jgi:hypothetical protein
MKTRRSLGKTKHGTINSLLLSHVFYLALELSLTTVVRLA